jgi:phosphatidylserine/phosphatidylglycerophosphate/cardiolipin synthase-like enzyme
MKHGVASIFSALMVAAVAAGCSASNGDSTDSTDEDSKASAATCAAYAAPTTPSSCEQCDNSTTGKECQANGCYGGYYCLTTTSTCKAAPPSSCPPPKDAGAADSGKTDSGAPQSQGPTIISSFETPTPAGLQPVIDAIHGAQTSIRMVIFHLTVEAVVQELVAAAGRGVDVQIIVDQGNWNDHTTQATKDELANGGVKVTPSSTGFRITHEKSFVVDETTAYVMSLNLTSPYTDTRDYAVVTTDPGIVNEFLTVFDADLMNAQNGTANNPAVSDPYLAWSPINSEDRLVAFVKAATKTLVVTSENIGDAPIQAAMIDAVNRGVDVRIIAPLCDQNVDPTYDLPFLAQLSAGGVNARAMPAPPSPDLPYMHAKMMLADGNKAFIGSVNFSTASTTDARELGIFFEDPTAIQMISDAFEQDWAKAETPPPASSVSCPATATN